MKRQSIKCNNGNKKIARERVRMKGGFIIEKNARENDKNRKQE